MKNRVPKLKSPLTGDTPKFVAKVSCMPNSDFSIPFVVEKQVPGKQVEKG